MRVMIRVFLAFILVFGLAAAAGAGTLEEIAKRGELRIACQTQGPPFSFVDKNGERAGSSVDFGILMAKEMGVKPVFLNYDWDGLIPALLSKKADVLLADMTPTLKRAMKISFSDPFIYNGSIVFAKTDGNYKNVADCQAAGEKLTVAVLLGSTGEADAKKTFPKAEIKTYKGGGPLLIDAVLKGHADVGVNDDTAFNGQKANFPPNSIAAISDQLSKQPLAFALRYDSPNLRVWINLFLLTARLNGEYDKNLNYWVNSLDWKKDH